MTEESTKEFNYYKSSKVTDIIFIRHAESYNNCLYEVIWNKFGKNISEEILLREEALLRKADCTLSPKGEKQAALLGDYFCIRRNFQSVNNNYVVFSSPMLRCLLTSKEISRGLNGIRVTVHPDLYEAGGCYEQVTNNDTVGLAGMTEKDVLDSFPSFSCLSGMQDGWYKLPKAETRLEFNARANKLAEWIHSLHENNVNNQTIIIVCHGNLLSALIRLLTESHCIIIHNNTGISHIQLISVNMNNRIEKFCAAKSINRIDHLLHDPNLLSGSSIIDDHWIQEYLEYIN